MISASLSLGRAMLVDSKRLPIIALTADAFEEIHSQCLAAGMDDFLTKPISLPALKSTLSTWLPCATPQQANNKLN